MYIYIYIYRPSPGSCWSGAPGARRPPRARACCGRTRSAAPTPPTSS